MNSNIEIGFALGDTIALRDGVRLPDWTELTDPAGRAALAASMTVAGRQEKWAGISFAEDEVWRTVLAGFASDGRPPTIPELARRTGFAATRSAGLLRDLAHRDLVVLDRVGEVAAAYPFSAAPTPHQVILGSTAQSVYALCAIDALGMGGMLGTDLVICSACPSCEAKLTIRTCDRGHGIALMEPDGAVVWSGIRYAGGCAATSGCAAKLFFCSDSHLARWHVATGEMNGFRLSMAAALQVGLALFIPMLQRGS